MHFLYKAKEGGMQLPPMVPEESYLSIDGDNYFQLKMQRM